MPLQYHQATFDLIGKTPRPSAKARKILEARERALGITLPASLKEFYSIPGASKLLTDHSNCDPAIAIEELGDPDDVAHGVLLIQLENQSVAAWYVRLDGTDDPPVEVDSEGNRRTPPPDVDWTFWDVVDFQREADRFSDFVYNRVLAHGGDKRDRKTAAKLGLYGGQVWFDESGRAEDVSFHPDRGEGGRFVPAEPLDDDAMRLIRRLDRLHRLTIWRPAAEVTGWAVLRDHPGISRLEANDAIDDDATEHIAAMPALRELSAGAVLGDDGLIRLLHGHRFTKLQIQVSERMTPRGLAALATQAELAELQLVDMETRLTDDGLAGLAGLSSLSSLRINSAGVSDAGLRHLRGLARLESLWLGLDRLTDAGLEHLAGLTSLIELRIESSDEVSGAGFRHLVGLQKLRELHVANRPIVDESLGHLAGLPELEHLNIRSTRIIGPGLASLARLPRLRKLNCGYCKLKDEALHHLAASPSLEELDLTATGLTDAGVGALAPLRTLRSLDLTGGVVSASTIHDLKAAIPGLSSVRWTPPGIRPDCTRNFDFQAKRDPA